MTFFDLDIPLISGQPPPLSTITRAIELQFTTLAFSQTIAISDYNPPADEKNNSTSNVPPTKKQRLNDKKNFRQSAENALTPPNLLSIENLLSENLKTLASSRGLNIKFLSRLNLTLNGATVAQLKDFLRDYQNKIDQFHLLAIHVDNFDLFHYACETMAVDVIYFDTHKKMDFHLQSKLLKLALKRNIHFEFRMIDMFDDLSRRQSITLMMDFLQNCRGPAKSLIMSSGAKTEWDIRSVNSYKIIGDMLGVPSQFCSQLIQSHANATVQHGQIRTKSIMGALVLQRLNQLPGVKSVDFISNLSTTTMTTTATEVEMKEETMKVMKTKTLSDSIGCGASAVKDLLSSLMTITQNKHDEQQLLLTNEEKEEEEKQTEVVKVSNEEELTASLSKINNSLNSSTQQTAGRKKKKNKKRKLNS